jgi:ABC-2 type transport system ATP-binding protein
MEALCEMMGLTPFLDCTVITLSGGWKKKATIVCALMHQPKILFLDEPTAGLDTQSRHTLWDLIRQLNRVGTTIFLTTHYIEEAEFLCDRVAVINHGKMIALGTPVELCDQIGRIAVEHDDDKGVRVYRYFADRTAAKEFANSMNEDDTVLIRKTNLEDVFLELTGRKVINDFVKVVRV